MPPRVYALTKYKDIISVMCENPIRYVSNKKNRAVRKH